MVRTVNKSKIVELEEEVRSGFSRKIRKELNGVVQVISGKNRLLVRFQVWCKNNLSSNKLTIVMVDKIPVKKEPKVPTNTEIPEEQLTLEKG